MRIATRLFLAVDLLVVAGVLFFFVWGITDGTVSSSNAALWAGLIAVTIALPAGGAFLLRSGQRGAALAVLGVMAIPALIAALVMVAIIIAQPRWN